MLPSASPPGPSCSQASALKSDEIEPPNFSIRDFVFNLRKEDIKKNWPFPQKFLQVCLKNDVKDLLPPFESRCCSVRAKCCNKDNIVSSLEGADNINQTVCLSSVNQLVVENLSEKETAAIEKVDILDGKLIDDEAEILTTIISHDQIVCKSDETSENRLEETSEREVAVSSPVAEVPNVSRQRAEKKRKLIVKLSTMPQSNRAEDIGTASASVCDLMASKVCPVCKTFTSSSNTTLNAHIDQCLSEESNTKLVVTNALKVQVKPRKKKLMVDIYKTAPLCTLEDLDKRNGTNWASDLSLVAPSGNVSCEMKRPKLSPGFVDKGDEGAVYVDSNGIKIRILSKFNNVPSTVSGKEFKKNHLKAKYLKYLKVNTPKKKLNKRRSSSEGDCHLNTNQKIQKEESRSDLNAQDEVQSLGPATLGQWVCSKRSDMSRKLRNKKFSKSSANPLPITKKLLSNQTDSIKTSGGRKQVLKLSRLSEDSAPSTATKIVDSVDQIVQTTNEKNKSPKPPVFDPLSSSFEVSKSSCKESCHSSPKAGKDSSLKKNDLLPSRCFMGAEEDSGSKTPLISKKLRKHRSIGSGKWGSELTSCDDGLVGSVKAKTLSDHHEVNFSDHDTVMPGTSDAADHVPSRTIEISESNQGKEFFDISEMQKHSSGRFNSGEKLDTQVGDAAADEFLISDNQILDAKTRLDNLSSRDEHLELICGNETLGELPSQRSVDAEKMQCDDVVSDGIIGQSTLVECEATFRVKNTSGVQLEECQTGSTYIENSITCLKECVGVGLEISQEKSSITSIKNHMLMNRDPSSSPDSTASTMSHPSRDFEVKDKEVVDNSAFSLKNIRTEGQEDKKASIELNGMAPVKPIERLRDSQPCCWPHRESLFREPQLMRQCGTPKMMASLSKGNQMSSNSHTQHAICCSIPCPCLRTKNNISAITSSDSVMKLQNPVLRLMGKDLVVNHDVSSYSRLEHSFPNCAPDHRVSLPCYYHQYSDSSPFTSQVSWAAANQPMYFQSRDMMFGSKSRHSLQSHQKRSTTNQPMNERGMNPPATALFPNLMPHGSLYSSPLTSTHPFLSTPRPIPPAKMMRQHGIPDGSSHLLQNTSMFPSPSSSNHLTPFY